MVLGRISMSLRSSVFMDMDMDMFESRNEHRTGHVLLSREGVHARTRGANAGHSKTDSTSRFGDLRTELECLEDA